MTDYTLTCSGPGCAICDPLPEADDLTLDACSAGSTCEVCNPALEDEVDLEARLDAALEALETELAATSSCGGTDECPICRSATDPEAWLVEHVLAYEGGLL